MKYLSKLKLYQKLFITLIMDIVLIAIVLYIRVESKGDDKVFSLILEMEITMLQCRRAEKNFLMRHDQASAESFAQEIQDLRKQEEKIRSVTKDKATSGILDDINAEITIYENAFQDIKGLYYSATFYENQEGEVANFTAKRKPPPLEVVYNISKKINSKAMPLKAFWLGNHHLPCRWSFTGNRTKWYVELRWNLYCILLAIPQDAVIKL